MYMYLLYSLIIRLLRQVWRNLDKCGESNFKHVEIKTGNHYHLYPSLNHMTRITACLSHVTSIIEQRNLKIASCAH